MLRLVASRIGRVGPETGSLVALNKGVQQSRNASYYDSPFLEHVQKGTEVEKSYAEWKYVERLFPKETVPKAPTDPNAEYPSGWKPPSPPKGCSYFVRRNKNHMIPVYTIIKERGQKRETRIRRVEGDIWQLEKDIGNHLKQLNPKIMVNTYVQECSRFVGIKGDCAEQVKEWVMAKGF